MRYASKHWGIHLFHHLLHFSCFNQKSNHCSEVLLNISLNLLFMILLIYTVFVTFYWEQPLFSQAVNLHPSCFWPASSSVDWVYPQSMLYGQWLQNFRSIHTCWPFSHATKSRYDTYSFHTYAMCVHLFLAWSLISQTTLIRGIFGGLKTSAKPFGFVWKRWQADAWIYELLSEENLFLQRSITAQGSWL